MTSTTKIKLITQKQANKLIKDADNGGKSKVLMLGRNYYDITEAKEEAIIKWIKEQL